LRDEEIVMTDKLLLICVAGVLVVTCTANPAPQQHDCDISVMRDGSQLQRLWKTIEDTNCVQFLVQQLGHVMVEDVDDPVYIGVRALGFIYNPADIAYGRLLELHLPYRTLWAHCKKAFSGNNRLRAMLLARLCASQYPVEFTQDIRAQLVGTDAPKQFALIVDSAIEAYCRLMSLYPTEKGKGHFRYCSDDLFPCGEELFVDQGVRKKLKQHFRKLRTINILCIPYYARGVEKPERDSDVFCDDVVTVIGLTYQSYTNEVRVLQRRKTASQAKANQEWVGRKETINCDDLPE